MISCIISTFVLVFWTSFFEVYILILPGFGIVSVFLLAGSSKKEIFGYLRDVICNLISIGILGFFVRAHHMYTIGIGCRF